VIQGGTIASDGGGGGSKAWVASGTVPCRLAPIRGTERDIANRISEDAEAVVTLPYNAGVHTNHRLVIDGDTYSVEAVRDRDWMISQRVEVVKLVP
jgi:SPP1 family predicted phage head-tail adaptor